MKVDFHTHIFDPLIVENRTNYLKDQSFSLLYSGEKSRIIDHKSLIKSMDESGIDYAIAMGFPWEKESNCEKQNRHFSKVKEISGGRIIPFGSVPLGDISQIEYWVQNIKELGLAGIGEIAFYSEGLTYKNAGFLARIFENALTYSLPVCLHVNEPVGHDYTGKHDTSLSILYSVLKDFPASTVILAHWGGGLFFYELMEEVRSSLQNVYYDTAASPYLYTAAIFEIALRIIGSRKVLFGSDFPLINYKKYFDSIQKGVLSEEDMKNIYSENAARILNMTFLKK